MNQRNQIGQDLQEMHRRQIAWHQQQMRHGGIQQGHAMVPRPGHPHPFDQHRQAGQLQQAPQYHPTMGAQLHPAQAQMVQMQPPKRHLEEATQNPRMMKNRKVDQGVAPLHHGPQMVQAPGSVMSFHGYPYSVQQNMMAPGSVNPYAPQSVHGMHFRHQDHHQQQHHQPQQLQQQHQHQHQQQIPQQLPQHQYQQQQTSFQAPHTVQNFIIQEPIQQNPGNATGDGQGQKGYQDTASQETRNQMETLNRQLAFMRNENSRLKDQIKQKEHGTRELNLDCARKDQEIGRLKDQHELQLKKKDDVIKELNSINSEQKMRIAELEAELKSTKKELAAALTAPNSVRASDTPSSVIIDPLMDYRYQGVAVEEEVVDTMDFDPYMGDQALYYQDSYEANGNQDYEYQPENGRQGPPESQMEFLEDDVQISHYEEIGYQNQDPIGHQSYQGENGRQGSEEAEIAKGFEELKGYFLDIPDALRPKLGVKKDQMGRQEAQGSIGQGSRGVHAHEQRDQAPFRAEMGSQMDRRYQGANAQMDHRRQALNDILMAEQVALQALMEPQEDHHRQEARALEAQGQMDQFDHQLNHQGEMSHHRQEPRQQNMGHRFQDDSELQGASSSGAPSTASIKIEIPSTPHMPSTSQAPPIRAIKIEAPASPGSPPVDRQNDVIHVKDVSAADKVKSFDEAVELWEEEFGAEVDRLIEEYKEQPTYLIKDDVKRFLFNPDDEERRHPQPVGFKPVNQFLFYGMVRSTKLGYMPWSFLGDEAKEVWKEVWRTITNLQRELVDKGMIVLERVEKKVFGPSRTNLH